MLRLYYSDILDHCLYKKLLNVIPSTTERYTLLTKVSYSVWHVLSKSKSECLLHSFLGMAKQTALFVQFHWG